MLQLRMPSLCPPLPRVSCCDITFFIISGYCLRDYSFDLGAIILDLLCGSMDVPKDASAYVYVISAWASASGVGFQQRIIVHISAIEQNHN